MKFFVVFTAVLAVSSAQNYYRPSSTVAPIPFSTGRPIVNRVASSDQAANIIRYDNDIGPDGSYSYAFETDNGIAASAQGTPRNFGGNPPVVPVVSSGAFSWVSPEGAPIAINYIADENGYQPTGDALPVPPPIPPLILKALEYLAKNGPAPQK